MTLYDLKPRFQAMLRPLVAVMARRGITANQVTLAGALGSIIVGAWAASHADTPTVFAILPAWLFARMALNAIDGMLAREHGQQTRLGAYLNELADVVSDAALYLPFAFLAPFSAHWVWAVIALAGLSEFAGALGQSLGHGRRYDGPMGKSDRALVFGLLACWVAVAGKLPAQAEWLMPAIAALTLLTTINRVRRGLQHPGANKP